MGKHYTSIDEKIAAWVRKQHMFFVSTAPLRNTGLINCSPKGMDTLRILGPNQLLYMDIPGSGIETIAHLKENGRIVLMMCSFEGPPKIFRFHGTGRVIEPDCSEFDELLTLFQKGLPCRAMIKVSVMRIAGSCGYGVPNYKYQKDRRSFENFFKSMPERELVDYMEKHNRKSLDDLPALENAIVRNL